MKTIDLQSWARASQFQFFRNVKNPHFMVSAKVAATRLMRDEKPAGMSVFNGVLHAIMCAANAVPEFRMRFTDDAVHEHDHVSPSVTVPIDGDNFAFCDIPFSPDWAEFDRSCRDVIDAARRQTELVDRVAGEEAWIYLTCIPWIHFTAMTHPFDGPGDCIPRIAWGKIAADGERWTMPVAVQVHHALVDGRHMGQFFEKLETEMQRPRGMSSRRREDG